MMLYEVEGPDLTFKLDAVTVAVLLADCETLVGDAASAVAVDAYNGIVATTIAPSTNFTALILRLENFSFINPFALSSSLPRFLGS